MVTLNRVHGGSLVAGLNDAFDNMEKASIKQFGLDREKKDIDLLRQAQGLAPLTPPVQANNGNKKQRGFIRSISPQIADHIDGLNESRDVNGIDEVRNTAQMTIATARKILAAKTPAAKQKILLENAQKARKEGRDNTKMLKSAGMSPEQIDLQAQKALMVNEATLRTLPAPTGDERQAARSQLAIRNPQAYRMLVAEENARASKGRAAASKAQAAAQAAAIAEVINGGVRSIEGSGGAGPEVQTGGPVQPTGVQGQPRGRNPARTGDPSQPLVDGMNSYLDEVPAAGQEPAPVATEGFARDRGRVNPEMAPTPAMPIDPTFTQTTADPMPPQAPPVQLSPIETANGEYQDALGKWERAQDWAAETLQKAESLPPKARNALKAEVGKVVKQYEDGLGTRADQLKLAQDTAKFEADSKPPLSDLVVALRGAKQAVIDGDLTPEEGEQRIAALKADADIRMSDDPTSVPEELGFNPGMTANYMSALSMGAQARGALRYTAAEATARTKYHAAISAEKSILPLIADYEVFVRDKGPTFQWEVKAKAQAEAKKIAIQMQLKNVLDLGVLNGPDLDLMDKMVAGTTEVGDWVGTKDRVTATMKELRFMLLTNRRGNQEALFGEILPKYADGEIILNPDTGERQIRKNGVWVPLAGDE